MKLCATCSQPLGANNTTGICGRCWLIFEEAQKRVHKVRSRGQLTRRQREQREKGLCSDGDHCSAATVSAWLHFACVACAGLAH
jgi:hypothetical protein